MPQAVQAILRRFAALPEPLLTDATARSGMVEQET